MPRFLLALLLVCGGLHAADPAANTPEGFTLPRSPAPVVLARGGQALLPIVIAAEPSPELRAVADELAAYLGRITGATFTVQPGDGASGLVLGTLAQFPDAALAEPLALRGPFDGREAFAIRSEPGRIRLLGATDLGASHAAYRFLELVGCRWFFMGPHWEIVPTVPELSFDLNETTRPRIWSRSIWFDRLVQGGEPGDPPANQVHATWARRNRMAESLDVSAGHRWHAIPDGFKAEFAAHPEYFALVAGKRKAPQFCVTNPGLQAIVTAYARRYFEQNPAAGMVSLDPADNVGWCTCEACAALGHHSNQPFYLANLVGRELATSHPGRFVGLLAYSWHSEPPPFDLEPNVFVMLTRGMNASGMTFDELFTAWSARCRNLGIYEYYSYWEMDEAMLPGGGPTADPVTLARELQRYVAGGVRAISGQSSNTWGIHGLGYYLANRLMWSPEADPAALREDFLRQAFGPAAPAMARYYDRLATPARPLAGFALLRRCADDLAEATTLAAGHPAILARLDDLKCEVLYSYLGEQVKLAPDLEADKARTLAWFTFAYRIRNRHVIPWLTFRSTVGRPASAKFAEPTWFWRNTLKDPAANPWRVDTEVTSAELAEQLAALQAAVGETRDFPPLPDPGPLVLVRSGVEGSGPRDQYFSIGMDFQLASLTGEPLELQIDQRPSSIERPDARYALRRQDGTEVLAGELPVGVHKLALAVPGPGVYRFYCHSRGTGYGILLPRELPSAYVFTRGQRYRPSGFISPLYFYVPKGQREVAFHGYDCGTIRIRDGDGKTVHEAPADGRYVVLAVPPGQDGRVWSIGGANDMRLRVFCFLNLPTILGCNPDRLFVPAAVAERDGLEVLAR
jgi:hypothetical protein